MVSCIVLDRTVLNLLQFGLAPLCSTWLQNFYLALLSSVFLVEQGTWIRFVSEPSSLAPELSHSVSISNQSGVTWLRFPTRAESLCTGSWELALIIGLGHKNHRNSGKLQD